MSSCEHISKKTNTACGKPCPSNLKKLRCEKHGGEDLKSEDVNPYKPASKEWLEWNKKQKKKSKKDEVKVIEKNPYLEYSGASCAEEYTPLCYLNEKYLLKGTPIYHYSDRRSKYYVCNSIKIELHEVKNFKGWGTTEIEVVKDESEIDSKSSDKMFINQLYIKTSYVYHEEPLDLKTMTFRKYAKENYIKDYLYFIEDTIEISDEKERLINIAGGRNFSKHSCNYNNPLVKEEEKYTLTITLDNLSIEELKKLIEKKLSMRETYGDDYMYREFLYKRHSIKKIGGDKLDLRDNIEETGSYFTSWI
jgi:hypothetical protein